MIFFAEKSIGIFSLLVLSCLASSTLKLNSNGGYDFVIAVNDAVLENELPGSATQLRDNIKTAIEKLSAVLYTSTHERFFINSVELFVPSSWSLVEDKISPRSYLSSAIRINSVESPRVQNPHLCGLAGDYIELPASFFENSVSGKYGLIEKALLNLWARFRYGVWEEHGYIGENERFPYFYQPKLTGGWEVSGCSKGGELNGRYETLDGKPCNAGADKPEENCRFKPASNSTTTTSLMHFHFLESVTHFCDQTTHDKIAPTKQNLYCDLKSVEEIITSTTDYLTVTSPIEPSNLPTPKFEVVKTGDKPILYILTDRGRVEGSQANANLVPMRIAENLFEQIPDIITALGTYSEPENPVEDVVDWAPMSSNEGSLIDALGITTDGPTDRNFGQAIKQVSDKIKSINNPGGAAILVVKYGFGTTENGAPKSISYESEVIASLKEHNVKVYAVEYGSTDITPNGNLGELSESTGGSSIFVTTQNDIEKEIPLLMETLIRDLTSPSAMPSDTTKTIYKRTSTSTSIHYFIVPIDGAINKIQITVTSKQGLKNFLINGASKTPGPTKEWKYGIRNSYVLDEISVSETLLLAFGCETETECSAFVVVTGSIPSESPSNSIALSVSAIGGHKDIFGKMQPISVFAKIETKSGVPVTSNLEVKAQLRLVTDESTFGVFALEDDGLGSPDVSSGDGIYSGLFVPQQIGTYKVTVWVYELTDSSVKINEHIIYASSQGSLLPENQEDFNPCSEADCPGEELPLGFSSAVDSEDFVMIASVEDFKSMPPGPIYDLAASKPSPSELAISWTAPRYGSTEVAKYEMQSANSREQLLLAGDQSAQIDFKPTKYPGQKEEYLYGATDSGEFYFRIRAVGADDTKGKWSNIQGTILSTGRPWAKTGAGIAFITIICLLVVVAIGGGAFWWYRKRHSGGCRFPTSSEGV